jgi:hypothetical protein
MFLKAAAVQFVSNDRHQKTQAESPKLKILKKLSPAFPKYRDEQPNHQKPSVNGSEKLRCNPTSNPSAFATCAALSESTMKTMALTDVILPAR